MALICYVAIGPNAAPYVVRQDICSGPPRGSKLYLKYHLTTKYTIAKSSAVKIDMLGAETGCMLRQRSSRTSLPIKPQAAPTHHAKSHLITYTLNSLSAELWNTCANQQFNHSPMM